MVTQNQKKKQNKGKKVNKKCTKYKRSYRLTDRRIEWIYFLASDIPYILRLCPAVGAPVGLHLLNQAPAPFVCMWRDRQRRGL